MGGAIITKKDPLSNKVKVVRPIASHATCKIAADARRAGVWERLGGANRGSGSPFG